MSSESDSTPTLVGREADLARLEALFAERAVLAVRLWGVPGIGKSTLAAAFAERLRERGRAVALVDAGGARGEPGRLLPEEPHDVLVLDGLELDAPMARWLLHELEQQPERRALLVGRGPLPTDPAPWRERLRQHELGPLSADAGRALLSASGVGEERQAQILELAHGLPLALVLLARELRDRSEREGLDQVLGELARTLAPQPEDPERRIALRAAAVVRRLDPGLLKAMLGAAGVEAPATALYDWLQELGYARAAEGGLALHRAVADALFVSLYQREPELLDRLRRGAIGCYASRLESTRDPATPPRRNEPGDLIYDALYTVRLHPIVASFGVGATPALRTASLRPEEVPTILAAIERHEGPESAALARRWIDDDLAAATVHRDLDGTPRTFLYLRAFGPADETFDPVVNAALEGIAQQAPLREGERVFLARWWMSLEHGTVPEHPLQGRMISVVSRHLAFTPHVTIGAAVHPHPELWDERPDQTHQTLCETALGEHRFSILIHDWRRERPRDWFFRFVRALAGDRTAREGGTEGTAIVDREAFGQGVRRSLRHLRQPEALTANVLARAPLVVRRGVDPGSLRAAETLASLIVSEIDALGGEHGDLLRRTYVEPAVKQLVVADDLELPFSTYRRHLGQAVDRLEERLWAREIDAERR